MAREGGNVYKRQQKQKIKVKSVIQVDRSIKNSKIVLKRQCFALEQSD